MENKFDVRGYESIISQTGIRCWNFFSDVPQEVSAAQEAGMKGYVVVREGNKPLSDSDKVEYRILYDGFGDVLDLIR